MQCSRAVPLALSLGSMLAVVVYAQVLIEPRPRANPAAKSTNPPGVNPERAHNLRVDTDMVLVPVSVCDGNNRPVTGLEREHFKIFDNKVEQTVTHFAMDDAPMSVGLVFDTSGSMGPKLRRSRMAASAFFHTSNPEDEFFLVEFSDMPKLLVPLTLDPEEIQNQLTFAQSRGRTALLDAIVLAMHEMRRSKLPRKALLIISDGGDNSSRYSASEVRSMVRESDVLVYAIGIFEPFGTRGRSPEEMAGPGMLSDLAEQSGGRHFPVENLEELPDIAAKIGIELRNRYVLGYSPTDRQHDGRYHRVQVKVVPPHGLPPLHAAWRMGYYAPAE
jgi:Ca-activated chloride channel family protein